MTVTVIFFAALRDLVGCSETQMEISAESLSVQALIDELLIVYPRLVLEGVRIALNEEFVETTTLVANGDVVALIPPVSGG